LDAVVLCAGRGTRMRPLTDSVPKGLLPVCGKPLLDYHIEGLLEARAGGVIFVVNHLREMIIEHVSQSFPTVRATFLWQDNALGIADAFITAEKLIATDFLAVHTDNLFVPHVFGSLIARHVPGAVTMATVPFERKSPRNRAWQEPVTGRLSLSDGAAPPCPDIDVQTTGCCILPVEIFGLLEKGRTDNPSCDVYDVLSANQDELNIIGVLHKGLWANINTPEDLSQIESQLCGMA